MHYSLGRADSSGSTDVFPAVQTSSEVGDPMDLATDEWLHSSSSAPTEVGAPAVTRDLTFLGYDLSTSIGQYFRGSGVSEAETAVIEVDDYPQPTQPPRPRRPGNPGDSDATLILPNSTADRSPIER